jgi:serine/threonine protein kinase
MTSHVGKWDLVKTIAGGSFGDIFVVEHRTTRQRACAKIERIRPRTKRDPKPPPAQLHIEQATYDHLHRTVPADRLHYFPRIFDFGTQGKFTFMVMTLMKRDLESIIRDRAYTDRDKLKCLSDSITALETMHRAGVLHRDIKPRNICISRGKCGVALIDLGLSKKYIEHGRHIPQKQKDSIVGTYRYCSVPALLSLESSRRDDMESLVYTFINIFKSKLPWQDLNIPHLDSSDADLRRQAEAEREKTVLKLKQTTPPETLCRDVPVCLQRILESVQLLQFMEEPDYQLYRSYVQQDM